MRALPLLHARHHARCGGGAPDLYRRMGAAAMLLSNRRSDAASAKYKCHTRTRVCLAARNDSYK